MKLEDFLPNPYVQGFAPAKLRETVELAMLMVAVYQPLLKRIVLV